MLGRRRRHRAEHLEARDRAKENLRESRDALTEQREKASREMDEIIVPLRELRERNHFAELIIATIAAGRGREGG